MQEYTKSNDIKIDYINVNEPIAYSVIKLADTRLLLHLIAVFLYIYV